MFENVSDRRRQVFRGSLLTGPISNDESVEACLADLLCERKSFLERTDVQKASAWANDGESCSGLSAVEKECAVFLGWVFVLLPVGIEIVQDDFGGRSVGQ